MHLDWQNRIASKAAAFLLVGTVLLLLPWGKPISGGELYHWTDENGIRHYSNTRPPEGAEASVLMEEIPYDPEAELLRRDREQRLQEESEAAEIKERLEKAEREAEDARQEAEAARRQAEQLEAEIEERERDEDRAYRIYYPRRHPYPGHRPPGHGPGGERPPADRHPEERPSWYPPYDPFPTYPDKPWQQIHRKSEEKDRSDRRGKPGRR